MHQNTPFSFKNLKKNSDEGARQCDFRFDLFFSFSFSFSFASYLSACKSYTASTPNIKPADEDVLMMCLNAVHR